MDSLQLDLDDLNIESFATTDNASADGGTVFGQTALPNPEEDDPQYGDNPNDGGEQQKVFLPSLLPCLPSARCDSGIVGNTCDAANTCNCQIA
jgi:hypothetical protein